MSNESSIRSWNTRNTLPRASAFPKSNPNAVSITGSCLVRKLNRDDLAVAVVAAVVDIVVTVVVVVICCCAMGGCIVVVCPVNSATVP